MSETINNDRLEIINQVLQCAKDSNFDITEEEVKTCIEEFEALLIPYTRLDLSIMHMWQIPFIGKVFTKRESNQYEAITRFRDKLSITFDSIFASLYK